MKLIEGKWIAHQHNPNMNPEITQAFVESVPIANLGKLRLIWRILTDKRFYWKLNHVLKYAMRHAYCYRGSGASDVQLFKTFHCHKVFNTKEGWE